MDLLIDRLAMTAAVAQDILVHLGLFVVCAWALHRISDWLCRRGL